MCTVTIVPLAPSGAGLRRDGLPGWSASAFRLACNRDEAGTRLRAVPPRSLAYGGRTALVPLDGERGGTWIAVSDAGLAMTLLNGNGPVPPAASSRRSAPAQPRPSRGRIIPSLLSAADLDGAMRLAQALDFREYAPFRLIVTDGRDVGDRIWNGSSVVEHRGPWYGEPLLFTSSGLGDEVVEPPRRALFRRLVTAPGGDRDAGDLRARQDLFHRHSWPDRPDLSVCMRREEASTVSLSVIEVGPAEARFFYYPGAPDTDVPPTLATLSLHPGAVAA